jgi:hypothetical protein
VQVEDGLPCSRADLDDDLVVLEPRDSHGLRNELEHALRLVRRELVHVTERVDVALRDHEDVRVGLRVDVADRCIAVGAVDVVAVARKRAEEAVFRQRGSPPR